MSGVPTWWATEAAICPARASRWLRASSRRAAKSRCAVSRSSRFAARSWAVARSTSACSVSLKPAIRSSIPFSPSATAPISSRADVRRSGGEIACRGAGHRVEDGGERPVHQAPAEEVQAERQEDDRHGREHEGGLLALPLDPPQRVHAHRHDDGAVRLVLPLERDRHEVEADGTVGVRDELALGHGLRAQRQRPGRRRHVGAGEDRRRGPRP